MPRLKRVSFEPNMKVDTRIYAPHLREDCHLASWPFLLYVATAFIWISFFNDPAFSGKIVFGLFSLLMCGLFHRNRMQRIRAQQALRSLVETQQDQLERQIEELTKSAFAARAGKLAAQVSHDIRSPLSALEIIVDDAKQFPEARRVLMRQAIDRIRDIANCLLNEYSPDKNRLRSESAPTTQLLASLLESIAAEKRLHLAERTDLKLEVSIDPDNFGLFASLHASEFKRVLSNLVNNAAEAIHGSGSITLHLKATPDEVIVTVTDTGVGIAPELLPLVFEDRKSFGKSKGHGLGLSHAKEQTEAWGGRLWIESTLGKGTTVFIALPREAAPKWFISSLCISNEVLVFVDDDPTILEAWRYRLRASGLSSERAYYFSKPAELTQWHRTTGRRLHALYLVDYTFGANDPSGVELITALGIAAQAMVVTSRDQELEVLEHCRAAGVGLIPKCAIPYIPLKRRKRVNFHGSLHQLMQRRLSGLTVSMAAGGTP